MMFVWWKIVAYTYRKKSSKVYSFAVDPSEMAALADARKTQLSTFERTNPDSCTTFTRSKHEKNGEFSAVRSEESSNKTVGNEVSGLSGTMQFISLLLIQMLFLFIFVERIAR